MPVDEEKALYTIQNLYFFLPRKSDVEISMSVCNFLYDVLFKPVESVTEPCVKCPIKWGKKGTKKIIEVASGYIDDAKNNIDNTTQPFYKALKKVGYNFFFSPAIKVAAFTAVAGCVILTAIAELIGIAIATTVIALWWAVLMTALVLWSIVHESDSH